MQNQKVLKVILVTTLLTLISLGCIFTPTLGSMETSSERVDLNGIQEAQVELRMGAGELTVGPGTDALMEGDFRFSSRNYRPLIDYSTTSAERGTLVIEQEEVRSFSLNQDYTLEWDLRFTEAIPLDMYVALGAGKSSLDFSQLELSALEIDMGAGELEVYLPAKINADLPVSIQGGVGKLSLYLPADTASTAVITGGLGEFNVSGMERQGSQYIVGDPERGPAIQLDIEAGVGQMNIEVLD